MFRIFDRSSFRQSVAQLSTSFCETPFDLVSQDAAVAVNAEHVLLLNLTILGKPRQERRFEDTTQVSKHSDYIPRWDISWPPKSSIGQLRVKAGAALATASVAR